MEYITYGWYPEICILESENLKFNLLKNYFDILLYKDLIERYNVENEYVIRYLLKVLLLSNTKEISINKTFNELKSKNIEVSKNTLYNYLEYAENIFFIKKLYNLYSPKGFYKTFLYDVWFTFLSKNQQDLWKNLENLVFIDLLRQGKQVYYKKTKSEIDFYLKDDDINIQVCYELDENNYKREVLALAKWEGTNMIITFDQEKEIKVGWKLIKVLPFYKWTMFQSAK